jgi:hypothetical protein
LSACSFRSQALAQALLASGQPLQLDILTTCPNRYRTFEADAPAREQGEHLHIQRIELPPQRRGLLGQARAAWRYFRHAQALANTQQYDLVVATSSRIMTAVLGARIARHQRVPLYLDIRDIFSQNLPELFPRLLRRPLRWLLEGIERYPLTTACRVNLNSGGFAEHFTRRYPHQEFSFHTNGVDEIFHLPAPQPLPPCPRVLQVVYAGNIGAAQALHEIIPPLAARLGSRVQFRLYGDGNRLKALRDALLRHDVHTVEIRAPVPRDQLPAIYQGADVLFLHLASWRSCDYVLPSKVFEYIASGKPLWAGTRGWAHRFIREHASNAALFAPNDCQGALDELNRLELRHSNGTAFARRFDRRAIMQRMAGDIIDAAGPALHTPN